MERLLLELFRRNIEFKHSNAEIFIRIENLSLEISEELTRDDIKYKCLLIDLMTDEEKTQYFDFTSEVIDWMNTIAANRVVND